MMGDYMLFVALPIYIYETTGSTLATSLMFMAGAAPRVLLGSVAGVFVDRWPRQRTMVICNLLLALGVTPLLLVALGGPIWTVYVVAIFQSSINQFFGPAETALLPTLVEQKQLVSANALNALNNNLARFIGPAAGGGHGQLFRSCRGCRFRLSFLSGRRGTHCLYETAYDPRN